MIIINHHARRWPVYNNVLLWSLLKSWWPLCYVDVFYKYFILVYCVYMIISNLCIYHRLYHINSHILSLICTQQRLYHHHHRRYELSTSLYATYHPLSTYNIVISYLISWLPIPSHVFDASTLYVYMYVWRFLCMYICMYVCMYVCIW